jgi:hypothetical protein
VQAQALVECPGQVFFYGITAGPAYSEEAKEDRPELHEVKDENLIPNIIRLEPQRPTEDSKSERVPSTIEIPGRDFQ